VEVRREVLRIKHDVKLAMLPLAGFDYEKVHGVNCEAVVGHTQIPVGMAGPLLLDGVEVHVPLATTEGALVASTARGCQSITMAGGATSVLLKDGMTRAPLLQVPSALQAAEMAAWVKEPTNYALLKQQFESTSAHVKLLSVTTQIAGRNCYARFVCFTGDAMGMNMAGKACAAACALLAEQFPHMKVASLSGNTCADKKPTAMNWVEGRGKSVVAEVVLPGDVVSKVLKSSVKDMASTCVNKNLIGSAMAGAVGGFNAHAANVVAALFIATGQDPAQVVSSSQCITIMEAVNNGKDLHISCTMPSVEVGTLGGGTHLPAQSACLESLNLRGANPALPGSNAATLARTVCATVLAGEVSLMAALCSGSLIESHMALNRKGAPAPEKKA